MFDSGLVQNVVDAIFSAAFLASILRVTTPILLPSLGALISDRAGVINIGLEGTMLASAFTGVVFSHYAQEWISGQTGVTLAPWLGLVVGTFVGLLMALLLAFFHLQLKADLILSGIALNTLGSAATVAIMFEMTGSKGDTLGQLNSKRMPFIQLPDVLGDIPVVSFFFQIFDNQSVMTWIAFAAMGLVWYFMYRTPTGVHLRAVGENPEAAASVGIRVQRIRYLALSLSGILSGLGGIHMSMGYLNFFQRDMTSGRGFIALATPYLGGGNPIGTGLASIVFGFFDALAIRIGTLEIPSQMTQMIPYVATVMALVIYALQTQLRSRVRTLRSAEGEGFDARYWQAVQRLSVLHMFLAMTAVLGLLISISMYAAPDGFDGTAEVYPTATLIALFSFLLIFLNLPFMFDVERIGQRVLYGLLVALLSMWVYLGIFFSLFVSTTALNDQALLLGAIIGLTAGAAAWLSLGGGYLLRYAQQQGHHYWGDLSLSMNHDAGDHVARPLFVKVYVWVLIAWTTWLTVLVALIAVRVTTFWMEAAPLLLLLALYGAGMALGLWNLQRWGWSMALIMNMLLFLSGLLFVPLLAYNNAITTLLFVTMINTLLSLSICGGIAWWLWHNRDEVFGES